MSEKMTPAEKMTPREAADETEDGDSLAARIHREFVRTTAPAAPPVEVEELAARAEVIGNALTGVGIVSHAKAATLAEQAHALADALRSLPGADSPAPEGGDLAALAAIVATAEQLAEKVQRAVGEEGDVFDFAAPERMAQADELSHDLLPLAEEVLAADVVTKIEAHRCAPSVATPPAVGEAANLADVIRPLACPCGHWRIDHAGGGQGRCNGCDCPKFGRSDPTSPSVAVPPRAVEEGCEDLAAGVWRSPDGTLTIRPEDTAREPVFIDEHFLPPDDAVRLAPAAPTSAALTDRIAQALRDAGVVAGDDRIRRSRYLRDSYRPVSEVAAEIAAAVGDGGEDVVRDDAPEVNAGAMTLEHAMREDLADQPMTPREAADQIEQRITAKIGEIRTSPELRVLIDHARATSPAPEGRDLADYDWTAATFADVDGWWVTGAAWGADDPSVMLRVEKGGRAAAEWVQERLVAPASRDERATEAETGSEPDGPGRALLRLIVDGLDPEPCPGGCGCRWLEDAEAAECGCDGGCCDEGWDRPERPDDPEDVLYSLNDLRTVLGGSDLSLEHALAAAANRLRVPAAHRCASAPSVAVPPQQFRPGAGVREKAIDVLEAIFRAHFDDEVYAEQLVDALGEAGLLVDGDPR